MLKENDVRIPSPFDDAALTRQTRMGLILPNGEANEASLKALAQVFSALLFDSLCDACAELEQVIRICTSLADCLNTEGTKRALLALCMQYDALLRPLPEPIWWIVGNNKLTEPFVQAYIRCLSSFVQEIGNDRPED